MLERTIPRTLLLCLVIAGASHAETRDAAFVAKAASGGRMEVELGTLAEKKAAAPAVKAFGQQMAKDHGKANQELSAVATQAGILVPGEMAAEHRATVQELSALEGEAFDRRYVPLMVEDHEKDVAAFREQASAGDSAIAAWAKKTLPTLEHHLEMAQKLAQDRGASGGN